MNKENRSGASFDHRLTVSPMQTGQTRRFLLMPDIRETDENEQVGSSGKLHDSCRALFQRSSPSGSKTPDPSAGIGALPYVNGGAAKSHESPTAALHQRTTSPAVLPIGTTVSDAAVQGSQQSGQVARGLSASISSAASAEDPEDHSQTAAMHSAAKSVNSRTQRGLSPLGAEARMQHRSNCGGSRQPGFTMEANNASLGSAEQPRRRLSPVIEQTLSQHASPMDVSREDVEAATVLIEVEQQTLQNNSPEAADVLHQTQQLPTPLGNSPVATESVHVQCTASPREPFAEVLLSARQLAVAPPVSSQRPEDDTPPQVATQSRPTNNVDSQPQIQPQEDKLKQASTTFSEYHIYCAPFLSIRIRLLSNLV